MPVDTTSETTEQQVSTVEENSLKQSKPDLPDIELPDDDPNEPTPSTSKNVLTDGLKQPLPDGVDSDKVKKIRRTEISEDKLEVTNKDDNKESHIELLLQKVSECLENTIDDESNPLLELKNKIYLTKNTDETKSIESPSNSYTNNSEKVDVCSNSIDQNVEVIDSDNSSDISLSDLTDLPEDISSIKSGVKQITKESLPQLLKLLNIKDLTVEKFERMCSLKVTESMVSKLFWSYKLSDLELLKKSIQFWQEKYKSLKKEFKELRHLVNVYKREEGNMKLPKQAIPLPRPDPVSIAVEDDDDAVELEFETVESASSSTSKITNKTTKKNGDSEKTITYLELSKNPSSSSSSFITGTASRSPRRTSVLNKDTINTSPKSKKLEPISIEVSPPVPGIPNQRSLSTWKGLPPAPHLSILKSPEVQNMPQALVLLWTMNVNRTIAEVISYQIYAYQETPDQPPNIDLWKKIGDVNALPLPMACSLTHLSNGQKYHFIVRAVDVYTRVGPFSTPESIIL